MLVNLYNFNGILDDLYDELLKRNEIIDGWGNADVVVVWQDVIGELRRVVEEAKRFEKRVIVAEHGLVSAQDYVSPPKCELIADYFMVWGKKSKELLVKEARIPARKVKITGTTIFSKMGKRIKHDGYNILFNPRHWAGDLEENRQVANILKKLTGAYVYTKIIYGEHDLSFYPNPIISQRSARDHLERCYEALSVADVVVGIGEGTFAALAYYMGIPYISVDNWKPKELLGKVYTKERWDGVISYACRKVKPRELIDAVWLELKNPKGLAEERKKFVKEYLDGGNPKKALKKQLKVVYG